MKKCEYCGEEEVYSNMASHSRSVGDQRFSGMLPAELCNACHQTNFSVEHLAAFNLAVAYLCATLKLTSPEAFKFMRAAIGISDVEMAGFMGETVKTIRQWEDGSAEFGPGAFAVLRVYVEAEFNKYNIKVQAHNHPGQEIRCASKLK